MELRGLTRGLKEGVSEKEEEVFYFRERRGRLLTPKANILN